jgi:hypothetical protein
MPYFLITLALQVVFAVHCIRTGRNTVWVWIIVLLPLAGVIAYVIVEILPELFGSRTARRAARDLRSRLDPERELRAAELAARGSTDVASRQRYADELLRQNRPLEAVAIYQQLLTGLYEHDPNLMLRLAHAQFDMRDYATTRGTLEELIAQNPDFKSPEGHLLYARTLEELQDVNGALSEYEVLARSYPGAEPTVRYARLLRSAARDAEATQLLRELLERAERAPKHYRRAQQEWLDAARREAQ